MKRRSGAYLTTLDLRTEKDREFLAFLRKANRILNKTEKENGLREPVVSRYNLGRDEVIEYKTVKTKRIKVFHRHGKNNPAYKLSRARYIPQKDATRTDVYLMDVHEVVEYNRYYGRA